MVVREEKGAHGKPPAGAGLAPRPPRGAHRVPAATVAGSGAGAAGSARRLTLSASSPQDYREDGMDLGSDAGSSSSSRASSQSNSAKVTPCSECKSSSSPGGSLDLVSALEDYEEPFPVYQKKVIDEWAPEEDGEEEEEENERGYRDDRCPARETGDVSARTCGGGGGGGGGRSTTTTMPPPMPNGNLHPHDPQDLRYNGNVVLAGRPSGSRGPRRATQKPQPEGSRHRGRGPAAGGLCLQPPDCGTCVPEEPPVPPMDWEALEKHLAGLQFREQEVRNQGQARTNSTSVSWPGCVPTRAHTFTHPARSPHAPSPRSPHPPARLLRPHSSFPEGGGWAEKLAFCSPGVQFDLSELCLGLLDGRRGGRSGQRAAESPASGTGDSFCWNYLWRRGC